MEMEDVSLEEQPEGKRWDPLGAPDDEEHHEESAGSLKAESDCHSLDCTHCHHSIQKLKTLEQEQEVLNTSLLALTTHFAQVQFRLRQIVSAPLDDKEELLKALEEFAFRGVPDVNLPEVLDCTIPVDNDERTLARAVQVKRCQQRELIDQLKKQLRELESYAYETGEAGLPQDVLLERQRVILDELKAKMNLDVDELQPRQVSADELRLQVCEAVGNIVSPLKMKEQLVNQLKTQVADLERFVQFLQQADMESRFHQQRCSCGVSSSEGTTRDLKDSINMIKRAAALLQMFAVVQFGCGSAAASRQFRRNDLKSTPRANHWGDVRARLQIAVGRVLEEVREGRTTEDYENDPENIGGYSSDTDDTPTVVSCDVRVTKAVRRDLAPALRDLMQHGLTTSTANSAANSGSLVPFMGCFSRKSHHTGDNMHAWELVMEYYELKNGEHYNATPARKLSQSFNLDMAGSGCGAVVSNKQSLLGTIGGIITTHSRYKRSADSHFKAFVCAALNGGKLVAWLRLIYQCRPLVGTHYQPWSYAVQTGFQDGLQCLDALTTLKFDLPVDLAVRQFQSIKDVFT